MKPISPELALAAACCGRPVSDAVGERIRAAADHVGDWNRFYAVTERNRISLMVHESLGRSGARVPPEARERLQARARILAARGLRMANECLRLRRAFDTGGAPLLFLKGVPLGILAYGGLGTKQSWDIDVLVARKDMDLARELLVELGYHCEYNADQFARYIEHEIEVVFTHPVSGLAVELHHKLTRFRHLLPGLESGVPAQRVALPVGSLPTLADEPLFAYLCVHGATHAWGRLKWLADLNAFVARRSDHERERFLSAAIAFRAHRSASVALMLCRDLCGLELSEPLAGRLENTRISRMLVANSLAVLNHRGGKVEHQTYSAAWLRTLVAQGALEPGKRHLVEQLRLVWNSAPDRATVPLPPRLSFLYHLLRLPLWCGRLAKRLI